MLDAFYLVRMILKLAFGLIGFALRVLGSVLKFGLRLFAKRMTAFEGRVRVIDGDSLAVIQNGQELNIRLFGIDAPEYDQPEGPAATQTLRHLVSDQDVHIIPQDRDRYGRIVARVLLQDGTDVASEMVRRGMALADTRFSIAYTAEQSRAQSAHAGFWQMGGIIDPAIWRQNRNS